MKPWFSDKADKYKYKESKNTKYDIDEGQLITITSPKKKALMWGIVWLIMQALLVWLFFETGNFVTIIPLPLFLAFRSFRKYFNFG